MHRVRSLVVATAATALTFTGMSTAAAGDDYDDDLYAKVLDIHDEAEANDEGTKVDVTFEYKCDNDDDDEITTKVTLRQDGSRFGYEDDADLDCNGKEHEKTVTLENHGDDLENGDAWVTVRFLDDDDEELDKRSEKVEVSGVDDDDDDDGDDKRHHDNGDEGKDDDKDDDKGHH